MKAVRIGFRFVWVVLAGGIVSSLEARSLSEQIDTLFGKRGIELRVNLQNPQFSHTAHFSNASLATLGLLTAQLASSAADFPAISTVPGLTYRYNPQIQAFERSTTSLGSVFVERPQPLGRGKFDLGFSYLFIDFDELEGENLDGLTFRGLQHNDCCPPAGLGMPSFENATADLLFEEFDLRSHVLSFFGTYGVTDRWDVSILIPLVFTSLDVRARARINDTPENVHFFDDGLKERVRSIDDSSTGVGDILLRTKYHLFESKGFNLASGLILRLPTGDEDDFQGIGILR